MTTADALAMRRAAALRLLAYLRANTGAEVSFKAAREVCAPHLVGPAVRKPAPAPHPREYDRLSDEAFYRF